MGETSADQAVRRFLATIHVGDLCQGTVTAATRPEASVILDGFAAYPLGMLGVLDGSWRQRFADVAVVGRRIIAEVIAVDPDADRVRMSMAATENPELWAFLKQLRLGEFADGITVSLSQ
ncbi:hypothetical protein [Streptomyces sp. KMM 9044]|uniref:hypothetical protein n=1 Tax=Streptomyces sp. KMM 9044 TaxID=2744474 RepID=UPI0021518DC2|nr:hypothetical protein [Streptomyces sp. KMM 9044]WAX80067.1 hypothetical protein HUV60_022800 [Streptomyces sp. KMM 9044]